MLKTQTAIETTAPVPVSEGGGALVVTHDYPSLIQSWWEYTKKHSGLTSAQSERSYRNAIKQCLNWLSEEGVNVLSATDNHIFSWLEYLKVNKAKATVQMYLVAVRLFFAWLCKEGFIGQNPCEGMKAGVKIDRSQHKRAYLSADRARALLAAMPSETVMQLRDRAIVALMITTGLRCCEVQKALFEDLRPVGDCEVLYIQGKGHSEKDSFVKVEDVQVASESVEIICEIETSKWEAKQMFRFYRTQNVIGDINVRDFHSKLRDTKCDNGVCVSIGGFSDSAHKYIDGRPVDLIEKDELVKILKRINMFS